MAPPTGGSPAQLKAHHVRGRPHRRRSYLRLSAKGRQAAELIGEAVQAIDETLAGELGSERLDDLVRMLTQLPQRAH